MTDFETCPVGTIKTLEAEIERLQKRNALLENVAVAAEAVLEDDSVFEGGTTYTLENLKDDFDALREGKGDE